MKKLIILILLSCFAMAQVQAQLAYPHPQGQWKYLVYQAFAPPYYAYYKTGNDTMLSGNLYKPIYKCDSSYTSVDSSNVSFFRTVGSNVFQHCNGDVLLHNFMFTVDDSINANACGFNLIAATGIDSVGTVFFTNISSIIGVSRRQYAQQYDFVVTPATYTVIDTIIEGIGSISRNPLQTWFPYVIDEDIFTLLCYYEDGVQKFLNSSGSCFSSLVGINDEQFNVHFGLAPNPTSTHFTLTSDAEISEVQVLDVSGKVLLTTKATSIDVSHFAAGVYLVQVRDAQGRRGVKKLVVD
jgi:hypothetical protein